MSELRYTLAQLDVQCSECSAESSDHTKSGDVVKRIVSQMCVCDRAYQERYAELLDISAPLELAESEPDPRAAFARARGHIIHTLQEVGEPWRADLIDVLREHVAEDRKHLTEIADQRPEVRRRAVQDTSSS